MVQNESVSERVAAWIVRKRGLAMYGFYAGTVAKEERLPLAAVRVRLDEIVAAGDLAVRKWEVICPRCDQDSEFSNLEDAEDEICLRCGEELDISRAEPVYGFRREG